jgi:hypothetical protein
VPQGKWWVLSSYIWAALVIGGITVFGANSEPTECNDIPCIPDGVAYFVVFLVLTAPYAAVANGIGVARVFRSRGSGGIFLLALLQLFWSVPVCVLILRYALDF